MAAADARVPADLIGTHRFPEGEVAHVLLGVVVGVDAPAGTRDEALGARATQLSIRRECGDMKVVAAVRLIRGTGALEALDQPTICSMYAVARG